MAEIPPLPDPRILNWSSPNNAISMTCKRRSIWDQYQINIRPSAPSGWELSCGMFQLLTRGKLQSAAWALLTQLTTIWRSSYYSLTVLQQNQSARCTLWDSTESSGNITMPGHVEMHSSVRIFQRLDSGATASHRVSLLSVEYGVIWSCVEVCMSSESSALIGFVRRKVMLHLLKLLLVFRCSDIVWVPPAASATWLVLDIATPACVHLLLRFYDNFVLWKRRLVCSTITFSDNSSTLTTRASAANCNVSSKPSGFPETTSN